MYGELFSAFISDVCIMDFLFEKRLTILKRDNTFQSR